MPPLPEAVMQEAAGDAPATAKPAKEKDESRWKYEVEVGVTATGGNTRTRDVDGKIKAERDWDEDRVFVWIRGEWGEAQNQNTGQTSRDRNRQTGRAKYEHDLNETVYGFASINMERDEFKDIRLRTEGFLGVGSELYKKEDTLLKGEIGFGYGATDYRNTRNESAAEGRISESYETQLNEQWAFTQYFELTSNLEEIDDEFRTLFLAEVRTDLTTNLYLSFGFEHRYDAEPARDDMGVKTNRQDYKFIAKLGYSF